MLSDLLYCFFSFLITVVCKKAHFQRGEKSVWSFPFFIFLRISRIDPWEPILLNNEMFVLEIICRFIAPSSLYFFPFSSAQSLEKGMCKDSGTLEKNQTIIFIQRISLRFSYNVCTTFDSRFWVFVQNFQKGQTPKFFSYRNRTKVFFLGGFFCTFS